MYQSLAILFGDWNWLYFWGSSTIFRCFCGNHNWYYKPNYDVFLTLTKCFFVPLSRCKGFADTVFPTFPRVPLNHHLATDQSHRHSFSCHLLSVVSHSLVHINFKSKIWKKFQFAHACRDLASPSDLVLLLKRRVHECMYVISHVGTSMYVWWQSVQ